MSVGSSWRILKCLALLELSVLAFCMALCNFSLAAITSAVYVPLALLSAPVTRPARMATSALGLVAHPLSLLTIACAADSLAYGGDVGALDAAKHALIFAIADAHIYGSSTFAVATVFLLPCWYLLWCLNFTENKKGGEAALQDLKDTKKKKVE